MFEKLEGTLSRLVFWLGDKTSPTATEHPKRTTHAPASQLRVIRQGPAMRVIFFYPGEEGTYVDHGEVTLYENGIVNIKSNQEETTTHLQNCEILWRFETDAEDRVSKLRLLKPKTDVRPAPTEPEPSPEQLE